MIAELDPGGDGKGAAMQGVHAIGVDVTRQIRRAADTADDADLVRREAELEHGGLERSEDGEVAAARAPVGVNATAVSVFGDLAGLGGGFGWCNDYTHSR